MRKIILFNSVFILFSCNQLNKSQLKPPLDSKITQIKSEAAVREKIAEKAKLQFLQDTKDKKFYLFAVNNYSLLVPGVEDYFERNPHILPLKIISGTSDAVTSEADYLRNIDLMEYALQYNKLRVQALKISK